MVGTSRAVAVWMLAVVTLLAGCGGHVAPVSERSLNAPRGGSAVISKPSPSGHYRVRDGDTLYSIAWRHGKDYRALARINGIDNSFQIYPGQLLRLSAKSAAKPATKTIRATASRPKPATTSKPRPASATASLGSGPVRWRWPSSGAVIERFSSKGKSNKGINIAGKRGDSVLSAAEGVVVYAGNGLLGYGNLVIINHSQTYLSAYAHNDRLLVKEQQRVNAGQKIAEIGNSGAAKTMLHFEIRKEGKPVDPLRYLPKR